MNVSTSCGCFFSAAFNSVAFAMAYLVPFDYILMITAGNFIKLESLPPALSFLSSLSWLMYGNEAMSIVQFEGVQNISEFWWDFSWWIDVEFLFPYFSLCRRSPWTSLLQNRCRSSSQFQFLPGESLQRSAWNAAAVYRVPFAGILFLMATNEKIVKFPIYQSLLDIHTYH